MKFLHATMLPTPQPVTQAALLLHGILGSGRNLRTFGTLRAARRVAIAWRSGNNLDF